jgi:hypothetical protein
MRPTGLAARLGCVLLAIAAAYAVMAPLAFRFQGAPGLWAASVATGVCLFGALAALLAADVFSGPDHALTGALAAMLVRMGVPLAFCLVVYWHGGALAEAGAIIYLLVMYMLALAVETWLAVGRVGPSMGRAGNVVTGNVVQASPASAKLGER